MILTELIHDVQMYLSFSGTLPQIIPNLEIERLIENEAKPWFYRNVYESVIKEYLYIPRESFKQDLMTKFKFVTLPCETQRVVWLYQVNDVSLFSFGINAPNLSVNLGISNQPYLSSITTTIGELGVYKVVIDGFADMLNQLTKHTLKYDFNPYSKQLNILTSTGTSPYENTRSALVAEVYNSLADQDLFDSPLFRQWVRARSGMQLGRLLLRYQYSLPGGVQINSAAVLDEAKAEMEKIEAEIKSTSTNAIMWLVKR